QPRWLRPLKPQLLQPAKRRVPLRKRRLQFLKRRPQPRRPQRLLPRRRWPKRKKNRPLQSRLPRKHPPRNQLPERQRRTPRLNNNFAAPRMARRATEEKLSEPMAIGFNSPEASGGGE